MSAWAPSFRKAESELTETVDDTGTQVPASSASGVRGRRRRPTGCGRQMNQIPRQHLQGEGTGRTFRKRRIPGNSCTRRQKLCV